MTITFCGHSDFCEAAETETALLDLLEDLIGEQSVEFFLGGYGNFDRFAYSCCKKYKENHKNASLVFVTPYITEDYEKNHLFYIRQNYDSVIYPPIENRPLKFAISYRNQYMIDSADIVISYIQRHFGGAYKTYEYARKKNKPIYNI